MHLRDIDSWLPVALVAVAALIIIPACLPKDSGDKDNRRGGSGWWDSGWDSYSEFDEYEEEDDGSAATEVTDAALDLTWNMANDVTQPWDAAAIHR